MWLSVERPQCLASDARRHDEEPHRQQFQVLEAPDALLEPDRFGEFFVAGKSPDIHRPSLNPWPLCFPAKAVPFLRWRLPAATCLAPPGPFRRVRSGGETWRWSHAGPVLGSSLSETGRCSRSAGDEDRRFRLQQGVGRPNLPRFDPARPTLRGAFSRTWSTLLPVESGSGRPSGDLAGLHQGGKAAGDTCEQALRLRARCFLACLNLIPLAHHVRRRFSPRLSPNTCG